MKQGSWDKSLDSSSSELAAIKKVAEAAHKCLSSGPAGPWGGRGDTVEELGRKVLELSEHQQQVEKQMAHRHIHDGKNLYKSISLVRKAYVGCRWRQKIRIVCGSRELITRQM